MKKFLIACCTIVAGIAAYAMEPKCEIKSEFWGKRYALLTTATGAKYKVNLPSGDAIVKVKTKTGWYMINSEAKIVDWYDSAAQKGGK